MEKIACAPLLPLKNNRVGGNFVNKVRNFSEEIQSGAFDRPFAWLYGAGCEAQQRARYLDALKEFDALFGAGRACQLFSAPGRTEVGGNHTDHQRGRVLAASVNLDVIGVASRNNDGVIRIQSKGYPRDEVRIDALEARPEEEGKACALIRGVAARFLALGYRIGGFDAYTTSDVLGGSGLSSSAAFEVLVCAILSGLFNEGRVPPVEAAKISQYAENVYFGKPSGLMDQTASAVGGFVAIDFENLDRPSVRKVDFDLQKSGYRLCIVDTGGNHADLTADYAAIPQEMQEVAACFGKQVLREVPKETFYQQLGSLYPKVSNRAVARAIHFYEDNDRAPQQAAALEAGDFPRFLELVIASGRSSAAYLQNLFSPADPAHQGLTVALALSEKLLAGCGAWRVHGGGIAGTIQAYVPEEKLEGYREAIESVYGAGSCHVLQIRPIGMCEVTETLGQ
ncbi:MAG: galactokinase [Provencibacterium sp.]|jgi:galactokinase|nr:galactokinase [Provencibacterium sp.]